MKGRTTKNINETLIDNDFITIINYLSDTIKEYYEVTKNANQNEKILFGAIKEEANNFELILNENNIDSLQLKEYIEKNNELFKNLEINIISNEKNLFSFFRDAKILFKKMKELQEFLSRILKKRTNSNINGNRKLNNMRKTNDNFNCDSAIQRISNLKNGKNSPYQNSAIHLLKNINIDNNDSEINNIFLNNMQHINNGGRNMKFKKKMIDNIDNNIKANTCLENNINEETDIEKLKRMNKQYELHIKKLNNELKKYKIRYSMDNKAKYKKIDLSQINNENKKLRSLSNFSEKDMYHDKTNYINTDNILDKEKNTLVALRNYKFTPRSDFNYKIPLKKLELSNIQSLENEIEKLKTKINSIEMKLLDEQNKNKELINVNKLLNNKYKLDISILTKKNTELSQKIINKQNELLSLKKENIEKNNEIKDLKSSGNNNYKLNTNNENKDKFQTIYENGKIETTDNSKFLENFKNENEELIKKSNTYQEKIKYYQMQMKNIRNELYEKIQANIEQKNNSEKQINEMKNDYEKRIEDMNNKYKCLENNLSESQNFNNQLNQQINDLNQQIISKDINILELNYQIEQIGKKLATKEEENKKLSEKLEELNKKINDDNNSENQKIQLLQEQLKEQKNINNDLNNELSKVKKDNELLSQKIQKEKSQDIDNIKKENLILKENNEKLIKELKDIIDNNKNNEKSEDIQQIINTQVEKKNEEIKMLNKENEKIKEQLIRLSKSLPEEYNELLKRYKNLDTKYKNLLKNNGNDELKEEERNIELYKFKKEIETIKKKNMELVKELEEKEIYNKDCFDNKSEQNISNYEEEFDLRKMAKGAKDKNRSQDINIDYPGIQLIKEKYRELDFYYTSLEDLVKKLLLTIQCNQKNKPYVSELCKIVGFDPDTTNKILTNKNKNFIFGLFNK